MHEFSNKCETCGKSYMLNPNNATICLVSSRPYTDHVFMTCAEGHEEVMFFQAREQVERFLSADVLPVHVFKEAPDWLLKIWERTFYELQPYLELTERQEGEINDLAILLACTPDEQLMWIFEEPPPKPTMPIRWHHD